MMRRGPHFRPGRSLVTGASSGIGAEFARALAARGSIDLVVNNAGFAVQGPFADGNADDFERLVAVDIRAVVDICSAFLPDMIDRRDGTIVNVASTTAFQPVPSLAVYAAAKAFVLSFSQSLWYESAKNGVRVFALNPGPTRTEFFDVIGDSAAATGTYQTPNEVVDTAMRALDARRSRPQVISGRRNTAQAIAAGLVPARILLPALARMLR